ncbi:2-aminoethylphosphonate--pyruvate transaminase [Domibacillus sp. DTU_2020_1001157_1_SI_ALB_TIR_016]|uniref:2-aminoethylphosphonate--pyruvate transaminase n=1 Tax=Domibacillus sp. DTU_2020_1001157_1_SI_ALB_TIR_016 TaxID=3077789 RepID=UPI0028E5DDAF|nr:2-aminoethylphosphonate--pyruvate transaminase [Domibacillus sp. DTU_2020_1001157_1_SI_ALB_TIR_016]WNS78483.1 2-aminoethylphosphonate--pyruvate transaminase [Domibacillus sp. DTU_2020_1001157_1_SI_ALB_TIR_016]
MNRTLLLTPGPLTTTDTVKQAMLGDWCTWEDTYKQMTCDIRNELTALSGHSRYTAVLMQGSGTFSVEAVMGTFIAKTDHVLIGVNGAYGRRMAEIATKMGLHFSTVETEETKAIDAQAIEQKMIQDPTITHVMLVHSETTSGLLNPVNTICRAAKKHGKITIVDAMSSFGGMGINMDSWGIDVLVSSANKCLQGVPGFGFILADEHLLQSRKGTSPSLSMDVYSQYETMEKEGGKWRFTSPTHAVHAFARALAELKEEGGILKRYDRYTENKNVLINGMAELGFQTAIDPAIQSSFIVSFLYPEDDFSFQHFYEALKKDGFIIYPGKLTDLKAFRIGTIGDITSEDINRLLQSIRTYRGVTVM